MEFATGKCETDFIFWSVRSKFAAARRRARGPWYGADLGGIEGKAIVVVCCLSPAFVCREQGHARMS